MEFELMDFHRDLSDEELLQDILRVKAIYGKETLTREEYKKYGKFGHNTFLRHFGGWNEALNLCGMTVNAKQCAGAQGVHNYAQVTDEQLVDDLNRVANILCKTTFSSGEYKKHGEWSICTYFRRFGTWNSALENAGLIPYQQSTGGKIATEEMFKEIGRIWVKLGRQPTSTDIKNRLSVFSLNTFTRRFGSWRKALVAFINYVNNDNNHTDKVDRSMPSGTSVKYKSTGRNKSKVTHESEFHRHKTQRDPNLRLRFRVLERDHFSCCICGASPAKDSSVELEVDHIKPWSRGGETVLDNLQTLCSKCNLGKSNLM